MTLRLSDSPERLIGQFIADNWDASQTLGFDPNVTPGSDGFFEIATSIDNVGAPYPSLVFNFSNETGQGATTYDYLTPDGPGQTRRGSVRAVARAVDGRDYVGDSSSYSSVSSEQIVDILLDEVEAITARNPLGGNTELSFLGSQPTSDVPDDDNEEPTVRIAQRQVVYGWLRD